MPAVSDPGTFCYLLDQTRSAYWMRGPLASGWWGVLVGLPADEAVESWVVAARMHLLADEESPDDILPLAATADRRLDKYELETEAQWRARAIDAWGIYLYGGTEKVINEQLRAAGYGPTTLLGDYGDPDVSYGDDEFVYGDLGTYIEWRPNALGPRGEPKPYRTQFWVVFAPDFHPVTNEIVPWGDFDWGDVSDGVWGYVGYTADFARTVVSNIIRKFKPSDHVVRGLVFSGESIDYGDDGVTYGDSSITYGGSAVEIGLPLN